MLTKTVLLGLRSSHVVVPHVATRFGWFTNASSTAKYFVVSKAACFSFTYKRRACVASWGHKIDGTTQSGCTIGGGIRAAQHFDIARGVGVQCLHVKHAIGIVDRHTVLHHFGAKAVVRAAQTRAANGQTRFFRAKSILDVNPWRQAQAVAPSRLTALTDLVQINNRCATWNGFDIVFSAFDRALRHGV